MFIPEFGHILARTPDGAEVVFVPSLQNMASIGSPREVVETVALLQAGASMYWHLVAARQTLLACCVAGDPWPLVGESREPRPGASGIRPEAVAGLQGLDAFDGPQLVPAASASQDRLTGGAAAMTPAELLAIAQHLVVHGLTSKSPPAGQRGQFAEASALTMTQLRILFEAKFPDAKAKAVPTRDEYREQMADRKAKLRSKGMLVT